MLLFPKVAWECLRVRALAGLVCSVLLSICAPLRVDLWSLFGGPGPHVESTPWILSHQPAHTRKSLASSAGCSVTKHTAGRARGNKGCTARQCAGAMAAPLRPRASNATGATRQQQQSRRCMEGHGIAGFISQVSHEVREIGITGRLMWHYRSKKLNRLNKLPNK